MFYDVKLKLIESMMIVLIIALKACMKVKWQWKWTQKKALAHKYWQWI